VGTRRSFLRVAVYPDMPNNQTCLGDCEGYFVFGSQLLYKVELSAPLRIDSTPLASQTARDPGSGRSGLPLARPPVEMRCTFGL
jgi:hypothetical protein